jgi:hypothetical protein
VRYILWRWHKNSEQLLARLHSLRSQDDFDYFAYSIGESLVEDWGERNEQGELTGMNIGLAMKITNLVLSIYPFLSIAATCPG